jgi:hypothetical protein
MLKVAGSGCALLAFYLLLSVVDGQASPEAVTRVNQHSERTNPLSLHKLGPVSYALEFLRESVTFVLGVDAAV